MLIIFCYTCRQQSSNTVISEAFMQQPIAADKQIQRPTAKHQTELGKSCGRVGGRTEGPKEDRDSTERPIESNNLDPWGLPETEPPTKEGAWARHGSTTHMQQMWSLVFMLVPQLVKQSQPFNLLLPFGSDFPGWAALSGLSQVGCAWFCSDVMCQSVVVPGMGKTLWNREYGGNWQRGK